MTSLHQSERKRDPQSAAASRPWQGNDGTGDMAEVPVTSSLGSLGPLLQRLQVLMDTEGNLPRGVSKSDLRHLRKDLQEVSLLVMEISREDNPHFTDKLWVKEVRELSYDAEDYLDMALASANSGARQIPWILKRRKGPRIAKDISDLRSRLQEARERRHRYQPVKPNKSRTEPRELVERSRLIMDKVVGLLALDEKEPNQKVVPIFGVAGVGKTTLATRLYHHYRGSFHRRAFLRVSRNPDIRRLLTTMLSQIKGPKPCTDVQDLINNIRKCLDEKSYFIVLDDLWDTSVWDIISHAFPASKCYSRIIITTEIERVALACCSYRTKDMYTMDPLSPDEAQKLLLSRAFGSEDECHGKELKDVSDAIIRNTDGLPLAIIPIASMLASSSTVMEDKKKYIQESLMAHPTAEWIKEILNLVYSDLPDHLKTCLLYCNMYPEDYVIRKDDLMKQWVAEGFLTAVKLQDMEEVAGIYFDELVTRGMIQPLETNSNDEVLSWAVHHMVLDLIGCKSDEENFITVMYYNETVTGLLDKVRRLSLKFGAAKCARISGSFRMSQVRSLIFSGFFRCVPSLVEYRLLQVLILHVWNDQDKMNFNLVSIQEMFRLRYLKVECNMTVKLPASIGGLQCLGTMEIDARVAAIPSDIVHLKRLLHLRLPSGTDLPHGIGHVTSLRTLSYFNIGTSSRKNVLDLGKLTNLYDLHLTCSKVPSSRLHSNMKRLASILGAVNLKSLTLGGGASSDESVPCVGLGSISCPPFLLESLKLSPGICIFFHIPKWVGELSKLCVLKIAVKELSGEDVDMLKELPALSALSLYVQVTPKKIVIDEKGFSVLKNFKLICRSPCVEFMTGAMPTVRRLKLGFSAYKMEQCRGLEHLEGLSVVYAKVEGAGVDDSRRKAIQSALKDIFKTSPVFKEKKNSPVVNVLWVDRVFGDKETHPGSRPTTSSSEPSSSAMNPGEDTKTEEDEKHPSYEEQRENVVEDSAEHTIPAKGLAASARIDLSTEASPYTLDQVEGENQKSTDEQGVIIMESSDEQVFPKKGFKEHTINPADKRINYLSMESSPSALDPEDDRRAATEEDAIQTTNGQDDTKEDESTVCLGPQERELGDATKEQGGSKSFPSKELPLHLQYPEVEDEISEMKEHQSLEKHGARRMNPEVEERSQSHRGAFVVHDSSSDVSELGRHVIVEVVEVQQVMFPASKPQIELPTTTEQAEDIITEETEIETSVEKVEEIRAKNKLTTTSYRLMLELRKYILLLASVVAAVTYATGFSPPGDVWMDTAAGHLAGDAIIRDTNYSRYLAFYYCNATAFIASLVVIVLILILTALDHKGNNSSSKIVCHYRNNPWMSDRPLLTVMVLDLVSLVGAYAAGTFRDTFNAVYSLVLVAFVVTHIVTKMAVAFYLTDSGSGFVFTTFIVKMGLSGSLAESKDEESLKADDRFRKVVMLLATFTVSITYMSGLSAPGGFWHTTGGGSHRPGDAILKEHQNARLNVFFVFNDNAFVASLLMVVLLLDTKLRKKDLYAFILIMLVSLVVSYTAGSCRQTDTTVYVASLFAAILVYILYLLLVASAIQAVRRGFQKPAVWKMIANECIAAWPCLAGRKEKEANKAQSQVVLLATLAATITYQAGLDPPGGIWPDNRDGHEAGDPILLTTNFRRYNGFLLFNSATFLASLVSIFLVHNKLLLRLYLPETVMILDLFGLISAYVVASSWNLGTSIYVMAWAVAIPFCAVACAVITTKFHTGNRKDDDKLVNKRLLLFAILAATINYQVGLTPPGGFLLQDDESGHRAGHPVLLYSSPFRYWAFLYSNSTSFMLSIALIIILSINLHRPHTASRFAIFLCTGASLVALICAYAAGSSQHYRTSIYMWVWGLIGMISLVVLLPRVKTSNGNTSTHGAAAMEAITQDEEATRRKGIHAKRKYLMLLGILSASVTYKAGLEPPGGSWKSSSGGYEAGNPIMHDIRRHRYLVFFCSNSISFVASIVIILLLLVPEKLVGKHKVWLRRWLVVMNTTILLDLLGLLVAYAVGAIRSDKTSTYFSTLVWTMPAIVAATCIAIHLLLSIISKRSQSTQENNQVEQSPPV